MERILDDIGAPRESVEALISPEFLSSLTRASWPGNVRELRNHVERCLALRQQDPPEVAATDPHWTPVDPRVPYNEARHRVLADFERRYLAAVMDLYKGNISEAARRAGIARGYFYRLARRHGSRS